MNKKNRFYKLICVTAVVLLGVVTAFSAGEKQRMMQRVGQINSLKAAGVVGECANGLLGFVKPSPSHKALVDSENKDRMAVYTSIAQKQNVSAAKVAQRRAQQIASQTPKGMWLKGSDGKWRKK